MQRDGLSGNSSPEAVSLVCPFGGCDMSTLVSGHRVLRLPPKEERKVSGHPESESAPQNRKRALRDIPYDSKAVSGM